MVTYISIEGRGNQRLMYLDDLIQYGQNISALWSNTTNDILLFDSIEQAQECLDTITVGREKNTASVRIVPYKEETGIIYIQVSKE
jgi:hypothetical protein